MKKMIFFARPNLVDMINLLGYEMGWLMFSSANPEQFLAIVGARKKGIPRPECVLIDCSMAKNGNLKDLIALATEFCSTTQICEDRRFALGLCCRGGENAGSCEGCNMIRIFVDNTTTREDYETFQAKFKQELVKISS